MYHKVCKNKVIELLIIVLIKKCYVRSTTFVFITQNVIGNTIVAS